jgi:hypothetical protein
MAEEIFQEILNPSGTLRVVVVRRADGRFTYRTQELTGTDWGPASIDAGVYDSAETAETEARQRVAWLRDLFH